MVSASAVMRSSRPAMNSAWLPPPRAKPKLPEFPGGAVVVVDRLIYGMGVDLVGAVAVDRCRDMGEQLGQLRVVVGPYPFARGAPFGLGARNRDGTVSRPGWTPARS
jgi:hypothetical protein